MLNTSIDTKPFLVKRISLVQVILLLCCAAWQLIAQWQKPGDSVSNFAIYSSAIMVCIAIAIRYVHLSVANLRAVISIVLEFVALGVASSMGAITTSTILFIVAATKASVIFKVNHLVWILPLAIISRGLAGELNAFLIHKDVIEPAGLTTLLQAVPIFRKTPAPFLIGLAMSVFLFRAVSSEQETKRQADKLKEELESLELKVERERIARDIHDSLGHTLTTLNIQLDVALHLLSKGQDGAEEAVKTSKALSKQCLFDVRKALKTIKEPEEKFKSAISKLVDQANDDGLQVSLHCEVDELNNALSHHLFCIAQECLTNVRKHATASNANVNVSCADGLISLSIKDDGVGFDPLSVHQGTGVQGMKYRAESLGGTFAVSSMPDAGTLIVVQVPT